MPDLLASELLERCGNKGVHLENVDIYTHGKLRSEKVKIAIIDDEKDLCFLLSGMLSAQGFEVSSYYTLRSGLHGIKEQKPHWVILDNNLPDGLGWEHSAEILSLAPHLSLINISANPDSARTNPDPRVHYLIKPIDVTTIVRLIRSAGA
jgi:two-component system, OmpR family, response regulator